VFADKGYAGKPNRDFLALNEIADGIMRKDLTTAKLIRGYLVIKYGQIIQISGKYFGNFSAHCSKYLTSSIK